MLFLLSQKYTKTIKQIGWSELRRNTVASDLSTSWRRSQKSPHTTSSSHDCELHGPKVGQDAGEKMSAALISDSYGSILFSNSLVTFWDPRESPNDFPLTLFSGTPLCANKSHGFMQAFWCCVSCKPCFNQTCWVSTVRSCCCNGGMAKMKWRCNGTTWFSHRWWMDDGHVQRFSSNFEEMALEFLGCPAVGCRRAIKLFAALPPRRLWPDVISFSSFGSMLRLL